MKKILKFEKDENGQSLVEFALILPILMALVLGMIEFGWILNGQITLTSAAREGARTAVVCESEGEAKVKATDAVKSALGTNLTVIDVNTSFLGNIATVNVTAEIKPIVSSGKISLTAKAEMRIE